MGETRQNESLATKPCARFVVTGAVQHLDCDITIEVGITRAPNFAHSSTSDPIDETVSAERGSGGEIRRGRAWCFDLVLRR